MPSLDNIKDGLFKLILFANLDSLMLNNKQVTFISKLKLTGRKITGSIELPRQKDKLEDFIKSNQNNFNKRHIQIINKLLLEFQSKNNRNLRIEITKNY